MTERNGSRAARERRLAAEVDAAAQASFVHCLNVTDCSDARAAREMGISRSNVRRYVTGELPVNPRYVNRSKLLWRAFHLCQGRKLREIHEGRGRTLPHVLRAKRRSR
jgi:hypothetical protein